jgi:RNA polymerase sigma factor (sigma-70 family)
LANRLAEIARRTGHPTNGHVAGSLNSTDSGFIQVALGEQSSPSSIAANREFSELIRAGLMRMSPRDRQVLCLRFDDQLTFTQIGDQLGLREDAARMLFNRAVKRLRRELPSWTA